MFKFLAMKELARKYELPQYDIFLPTGGDCILESVLMIENITDEYGCNVNIVQNEIKYLLLMAIPLFGIAIFFYRIFWRCKLLYFYIIPTLHPQMSDWCRLCYCIVPPVYYFRVWRELK